jgi:nitroimidazol reductase NimA-like FMN-containing flavoprotein (pyridoxamine 5'-phosphate oxidase superfamily)
MKTTYETPITDFDPRFSTPDATALAWTDAEDRLRNAALFWLATVRAEGRPHVAPLLGVWLDGALYFATGEGEQKAKNLATNTRVTITTGCASFSEGLDIVVEGEALVVKDKAKLQRVMDAYVSKYGEGWRIPEEAPVLVFELAPAKAFGFGRGEVRAGGPWFPGARYNQTRWRFQARPAATRP